MRLRPTGNGFILDGNTPLAKFRFEMDQYGKIRNYEFEPRRKPFKIPTGFNPKSEAQGCCDPPPDADKRP